MKFADLIEVVSGFFLILDRVELLKNLITF